MMSIPRVIHQQWGSQVIPARYQSWVDSWKTHHPGWQHILWTDESCARFVRSHYPAHFLLYNSYDEDVKRYDAFRYFLMHHSGGLYVDLDFECLASFDTLFESGVTCVLGYEPDLHAKKLYGLEKLIGNALIASAPGHRFWEHVFQLMASRSQEGVLEATGPKLLQQAIETYRHGDLALMDWQIFYPLVDFRNEALGLDGDQMRDVERMARTRDYPEQALAVHHWMGTWYRGGFLAQLRRFIVRVRSRLGLGRH